MRLLFAALGAFLLAAFAAPQAEAQQRSNAFSLSSSLFGSFDRRARVQRLKRRRALLRRGARTAGPRRSRIVKRRRVVAKRTTARKARTRRASRTKARRAAARRKVRRTSRRTAKRSKVVRRKRTAARKGKAKSRRFARQTVRYSSGQKPGTVVVDTKTRHLYLVLRGNKAIRYGVAVGKEGFAWSGVSRIRRKVEWPTWTPPREMIERKPELAEFAGGMPGGPNNPLGARALYLFQGKKDTLYRIHGTNNPASIGRAASSGCIRMRNEDVAHLYARVAMGAKVIVR